VRTAESVLRFTIVSPHFLIDQLINFLHCRSRIARTQAL
jgi:hypothetical protein